MKRLELKFEEATQLADVIDELSQGNNPDIKVSF